MSKRSKALLGGVMIGLAALILLIVFTLWISAIWIDGDLGAKLGQTGAIGFIFALALGMSGGLVYSFNEL